MTNAVISLLLILFFFTSAIGVVTGSNSLITVPVMFQFGIDEKVAVATNMFGLTFMAVGGAIPFVRRDKIDIGRIMPMIVLTIVSSAIGAAMVGLITDQGIKLMVSIAMITVAAFTLIRPDAGIKARPAIGRRLILSYLIVFLLGIYGGLYSGGYVTILTSVLVVFFGMTFSESVAATKVINVFSSLIASIVFMWQGLVDYRLGIMLAVVMFAGAFAGAHFAARMNEIWLKRIFLAAVVVLAVKILFDLFVQ